MRLLSYILRALCAVAVGFLLVSNPSSMANLLIQIVGGLFAFSGLLAFIGYFSAKMNRGSALRPVFPFVGIGSLAFGTVLILWPTQFKEIFMYVIGALLVIVGLSQMWSLFRNRKVAPISFSLFIVPLLVVIAAGVMILRFPAESASFPLTVFGIIFILYGVSEFFLGLRLWRWQKAYDAQFIEAEEITDDDETLADEDSAVPGEESAVSDEESAAPDEAEIPEAKLITDTSSTQSE